MNHDFNDKQKSVINELSKSVFNEVRDSLKTETLLYWNQHLLN